jgi:hypothetical protein
VKGPVQLAIPNVMGRNPRKSSAELMQRTSDEWDAELFALARTQHRTIAWWWGLRTIDGMHMAFCYVCDACIIRCSPARYISTAATDAIDSHRTQHVLDLTGEKI